MTGLVHKLAVFAAIDGLILKAHGPGEHHKELQINYKGCDIRTRNVPFPDPHKQEPHLEVHGIVGLLSIASSSFLISITRREEVAQIFGKPVFVIKEVTLLPLSSQQEANKAISDALASESNRAAGNESSDESDGDLDVEPQKPADMTEKNTQESTRPQNATSITEHVINKQSLYGSFTSQWLNRAAWNVGNDAKDRAAPSVKHDAQSTSTASTVEQAPLASNGQERTDVRDDVSDPAKAGDSSASVKEQKAIALVPNVLRNTKLILGSSSFYFSYDIDLTRSIRAIGKDKMKLISPRGLDTRFFWNKYLCNAFMISGNDSFVMPIMQGFVGQRTFAMKSNGVTSAAPPTERAEAGPVEAEPVEAEPAEAQKENATDGSQNFLLTLISRRSIQRSGLRYLRRGIDDQGDCANTVETEQILSSPTWEMGNIYSFLQIRGSIPLYFSQTAYALKPVPVLHHSPAQNQTAITRHFDGLRKQYGGVQAALLVNKHGVEEPAGRAYQDAVSVYNETHEPGVGIEWFDFHAECRGMKFENVERLVKTLETRIHDFGETVVENGVVKQNQTGIIRTNCMDCLDRTNVAQSAFGQFTLQSDLKREGYEIDLLHDEGTQWFNTLWADNGDAISRQYAGTAALKGDFTRTRKRNYRGALTDLSLTLNRYYNNMINDYFSQAVIDMLLGNVSSSVLEDFESTMMSKDPGISLDTVRETAIETCKGIVIQTEDEDLIHGWTLLTPAQPNTLRTLPFEEAIVLLTDAAIYCCKFDWNTEKVHSFEKIDLRSITKIRHGIYITSTLTDQQMREDLNAGLVIEYKPGSGALMRVNTRSLHNYVTEEVAQPGVDGGRGILSWMGPRNTPAPRTMALKVIPKDDSTPNSSERPSAIAEQIAAEIRKAITGSTEHGEQRGLEFVEQGDILSLAEARKRTGYIEQLSHSVKRLVWT